jgi:membrane protein
MELVPLRDSWPATFKRAGKRFLADDCTGLAQEVAYSSLLAFFPAVVALVGLLDLLHAYGALDSFLSPVAPRAVTSLVRTFEADSGSGSGLALALGLLGAIWAASGAMGTVVKSINRAYGCEETRPLWKKRLVAIVLVLATAIVTVGTMVVIVFGGTLGNAVARRAGLGSPFRWAWGFARWPLGLLLVLALLALIYEVGPTAAPATGGGSRPGRSSARCSGSCSRAGSRSTRRSRTRTRGRTGRSPAESSCCSG